MQQRRGEPSAASNIVQFLAEQLELLERCRTMEDGPYVSRRALEIDSSASIEQAVSSMSLVSGNKSVFAPSSMEPSASSVLLLEGVCTQYQLSRRKNF